MKRAAVALVLVVAAWAALVSPAAAGGWAVTTLDPLPAIEAGKPVAVGFTIRQHGVTPVDMTGVQIVVHTADGGPGLVFPARSDGPLGHYVAEVTFPAGAPGPAAEPGWPAAVRYGLLAVTVGAAVVFIATLVWKPRRRPGTASA